MRKKTELRSKPRLRHNGLSESGVFIPTVTSYPSPSKKVYSSKGPVIFSRQRRRWNKALVIGIPVIVVLVIVIAVLLLR